TEATAANVFFVRGRTVLTPELSGDVFPGVTRRIVIALLARMGVEVREVPLHPADTLGVSAAFISSTLLELRPIEELHGTRLDTATDDVFVELLRRFRDLTHGGDLEP
ncbi:MAG TPA: aminotransferase class IV, partial [Arenibaculum sp.]|nr:aminotransferase class IV [Arenibaculum sp.]